MAGTLDTYRRKRRPGETPEPFGDVAAADAGAAAPLLFVVQQHAARRTHFDLRLEWGGVLLSWAVPKGPSYDPADKPLAVQTEDHPLDYAEFEGVIPEGNYGAGAMIVWDRGRWSPKYDPGEGLRSGKLLFELHGYKLRGLWTLVRLKKEPKSWLLIKERDEWARKDAPPFDPGSVLSGLTVEEMGSGASRAEEARAALARLRAPRRAVAPEDVELMLAEPRREVVRREGWIFELKYDGFRVLAGRRPAAGRREPGPRHAESVPVHAGMATLLYRSGKDATRVYPEIARAVAALPYESLILDGEVAVLDGQGRPSFQLLQGRAQLVRAGDIARGAVERPAVYFVFDLLAFEGYDLRPLPLVERKRILRSILPRAGPLRYADHVETRGDELFEKVRALGVEGVVGKKADSPYRAGRHAEWLKARADHEEDFVVVGYTLPKGSRSGFGALHLGAYDDEGRLVYMGKAGSGFTDRQLRELIGRLDRDRRGGPLAEGALPAGKDHVWVEPRMVVAVRYVESTEAGQLRQPVFLRVRDDKAPAECRVPRDVPVEMPAPAPVDSAPARRAAPRQTKLSNLDKVFWPAEGYTKGDLIEYYRGIAPWLLPYLADRPLVLTRFPDGIEGKSFFQKNAPAGTPAWVRTVALPSDDDTREVDYFVCNDVETLVHVANLGTIPLHLWASRLAALDRPDWSILDLDPKGAPFTDVVKVARAIHALCDEIELECYLKTSGSSGLHVLFPLGGRCSFEQARQLAQLIASVVAGALGDIATMERVIAARGGRVYLDYLQNGAGKLLVAPFCVRPVAGARVSMPLRWSEATARLDAGKFTIRTAQGRLERLGADPLAPVLAAVPDLAGILARLAARMARAGVSVSGP